MRWPLYALVGADAKGRGLPLALMLTSTERASPIVQMFQAIRAVAPNWAGRLARFLPELYFHFNNTVIYYSLRQYPGGHHDGRLCRRAARAQRVERPAAGCRSCAASAPAFVLVSRHADVAAVRNAHYGTGTYQR